MSEKILDVELLEELYRIKLELDKTPTKREVEKLSKYSMNAYRRAFGGLNNALKLIGEKPNLEFNHTKEEVIVEINRLKTELSRLPTIYEFSEMSSMSFRTARNIYNNKKWDEIMSEIFKNQERIK